MGVVGRAVGAGAMLGVFEVAWVLARARGMFLDAEEIARYAVAAIGVSAAGCGLAALLGMLVVRIATARVPAVRRPREIGLAAAGFVAPVAGVVGWALTSGRQAREIPGREAWVVLGAIGCAVAAFAIVSWLARTHAGIGRGRRAGVIALALLAMAAVVADDLVFRGSYALFHVVLTLVAAAAVATAAAVSLPPERGAGGPGPSAPASWVAGGVATALVVGGVWWVSGASNARWVVEQHAPLTGKVLRLVRAVAPDDVGRGVPVVARVSRDAGPRADAARVAGPDWRDRDVLLVTVDALRVDRLAPWGGRGLTPELDALARESAVFTRAYTPTPHTSYAIGSLMTGRFLRPLLESGRPPRRVATLAELLGRAGWQTAAFYPPEVFAVDGERFAALSARGLGFAHRDAQDVPIADRARAVERWLDAAPAGEPVFVWAHVFEPHEPYVARPGIPANAPAERRYDGEVAAADAAIGALVRAFRARRPRAMVIVTADHGEEFGDHGGSYHGTTVFDEQVRVPLIWSAPGAVVARSIAAPVETVDVATTLLAALGVPRDPGMRGDDLGPLLLGDDEPAPEFAFADVRDERMVTDGRYKAVCEIGAPECRLYDLAHDPAERRNLGPLEPERAAALRAALSEMVAVIAREDGGGDEHEALRRAELGDPAAARDVVPLLGHDRPEVRAAAAKALARLRHLPARTVLARVMTRDEDPTVRQEAAIAALVMGDAEAVAVVRAIAGGDGDGDRRRRAALGLADRGDGTGGAVLREMAQDPALELEERRRAVRALGTVRDRQAVEVLVGLLADLALRSDAAQSLGEIGDRRAAGPLIEALRAERYPGARAAEARALVRLRDRRAVGLIRAQLGREGGLPGGVGILLDAGALARPSGAGADLRRARGVRRGAWSCDGAGCVPGGDAAIALAARGAPRGPAIAVVRVTPAEEVRTVRLADTEATLRPGEEEVVLPWPGGSTRVGGSARIVAIAVAERGRDLADAGL